MDAFSRSGKFLDGHRRTSSNNPDSYAAFKAQRGHRRTMSNTQVDLHRVMATSPSTELVLSPPVSKLKDEPLSPDSLGDSEQERGTEATLPKVIRDSREKPRKPVVVKSEEVSPKAAKVPELRKEGKRGSGFLGMLDAAIAYFAEDRQVKPVSAQSSQLEALNARTTITGLKQRLAELEVENETAKRANSKLLTQHDHYERHVNSLKTRVMDLQQQVDAQFAPAKADPNDSLDSLEPDKTPAEDSSPQAPIRRGIDDSPAARSRPIAASKQQSRASAQKGRVKVTSAIYFT